MTNVKSIFMHRGCTFMCQYRLNMGDDWIDGDELDPKELGKVLLDIEKYNPFHIRVIQRNYKEYVVTLNKDKQ